MGLAGSVALPRQKGTIKNRKTEDAQYFFFWQRLFSWPRSVEPAQNGPEKCRRTVTLICVRNFSQFSNTCHIEFHNARGNPSVFL
jgi:hypothetical protein